MSFGARPLMVQSGPRQALNTSIFSATATLASTGTSPSTYFTYGYGFDAGADPFANAGFGSITTATYSDGNSITRTVTSCYTMYAQASDTWKLFFTLDTLSVPDSDTTFDRIVIDGVEFARSDADASAINANGGTYWRWADNQDRFVGANPDEFKVFTARG